MELGIFAKTFERASLELLAPRIEPFAHLTKFVEFLFASGWTQHERLLIERTACRVDLCLHVFHFLLIDLHFSRQGRIRFAVTGGLLQDEFCIDVADPRGVLRAVLNGGDSSHPDEDQNK